MVLFFKSNILKNSKLNNVEVLSFYFICVRILGWKCLFENKNKERVLSLLVFLILVC